MKKRLIITHKKKEIFELIQELEEDYVCISKNQEESFIKKVFPIYIYIPKSYSSILTNKYIEEHFTELL